MKKIINKLLLTVALATAFIACSKPEEVTPAGSAGSSIVKFLDGGSTPQVIALDYSEELQQTTVLDIRRDANSSANLDQPAVITISNTQAYLDAYNAEHETEFLLLPSDVYTVEPNPRLAISGDTWTVTLGPGEFATQIKLNVEATKFDLSKVYALGLKINNSSIGKISTDAGEALVNILIKNQYHGSYHANGTFTHPVNGDRTIDEDKDLVTSGATSVLCNLGDLGGSGYQMNLTVNADNTVTITPAGATPNIDQHWGPNYYDPETHSFHLHYSYNTAAPRIVQEVITRN